MPVDLSIKRVPDDVARRLRRRAEQHHRSLQGELMAILQEAVASAQAGASLPREATAPAYRAAGSRRIAPASESALIIRQAREGRTFTVADLHRFTASFGSSTPDESAQIIRQGRDSR
jgi:plasmid stability protein